MQRGQRMFSFPFVIRITRVGNGQSMLRSGRRKMTREQFEAQMRREVTLNHIVSFDLPGGYELVILRKPR
jgi:hypothetical protein